MVSMAMYDLLMYQQKHFFHILRFYERGGDAVVIIGIIIVIYLN